MQVNLNKLHEIVPEVYVSFVMIRTILTSSIDTVRLIAYKYGAKSLEFGSS